MAEYIDRDELLKELCTVSAPTPSESWIVEKCIEKVNEQPTADVIPKEFLTRKEDEAYARGYAEAKTDVAREIFEDIKFALAQMGISFNDQPILCELEKKYSGGTE